MHHIVELVHHTFPSRLRLIFGYSDENLSPCYGPSSLLPASDVSSRHCVGTCQTAPGLTTSGALAKASRFVVLLLLADPGDSTDRRVARQSERENMKPRPALNTLPGSDMREATGAN